MTSFRLHGRGGQGVHTAGKILSRALFLAGFETQEFLESSQERRGYPVTSHLMAENDAILTKEPVKEPDFLLIMDKTLDIREIIKDAKDGSIVIINSPEKVAMNTKAKIKPFHVDSTGISLTVTEKFFPNMPMLGALSKEFNKLSLKNIKKSMETEMNGKNMFQMVEEGAKNIRRG